MNMVAPYGAEIVTDLLLHAGFILTAGAYLVRDILWLRGLAMLANACVLVAAWRAGMDPNWIVVAWASAFIAINLGHSAWLVRERYLLRLTEDEQRLCDTAFQALDKVAVRRLLRRGKWVTFPEKDCLARQGVHLDRLLLVASGEAAVLLGGRIAARLSTGKFIGEISFLSNEPSSAMVVATTEVRCLSWNRDELQAVLERRPDLLNVFHAAVGKDLAGKIAAHNVSLSQL